jgi:glutathione S-transferase
MYLGFLNKVAEENNGHLVLGRDTWADVYFAGIIGYLNFLHERNLIEKFPALLKIVGDVTNNPNVKAYIEKRPVTEC